MYISCVNTRAKVCLRGCDFTADPSTSYSPGGLVAGVEPIWEVAGVEPLWEVAGVEPIWEVAGVETLWEVHTLN